MIRRSTRHATQRSVVPATTTLLLGNLHRRKKPLCCERCFQYYAANALAPLSSLMSLWALTRRSTRFYGCFQVGCFVCYMNDRYWEILKIKQYMWKVLIIYKRNAESAARVGMSFRVTKVKLDAELPMYSIGKSWKRRILSLRSGVKIKKHQRFCFYK